MHRCIYLEAFAVELLAFRVAAVASLDVHPRLLQQQLLLLLQPRRIAGGSGDLGLESVGFLLQDAVGALVHLVRVLLGVAAAVAGALAGAEVPGLEAMAVAAGLPAISHRNVVAVRRGDL